MKQFCKLEGAAGNSEAYRTAWKRMFGRRTGEHSGHALRKVNLNGETAPTSDYIPMTYICDDLDCWCHR